MELPANVLTGLRSVCLALPDAYEEEAWVGIRWCVRRKTFAHVLHIADGYPPAYAKALGGDGPATVVTFRSTAEELAALVNTGHPFFKPVWFTDIVGMILDEDTDWAEAGELVTESYRILAPARLAKLVE
jgi:hypothetical protein